MLHSTDDPQPVKPSVNLKSSDLYEVYFFQAISRGWLSRGYLALFLVVLAVTVPEGLSSLSPLLQPPLLYLLLALGAYYVVLRPYVLSRSYVQQSSNGAATVAYEFDAQGVRVKRLYSESHYEWSAIDKAKQSSRLFVLYSEKSGRP
jgi:hypothetical protein